MKIIKTQYNNRLKREESLLTVFLCPSKVNPCRIADSCHLKGALLFNHGGNMRNTAKEAYSEQIDVETQFKQWERRSIEKDARRFEEIVKEARQRLGLEVVSNG